SNCASFLHVWQPMLQCMIRASIQPAWTVSSCLVILIVAASAPSLLAAAPTRSAAEVSRAVNTGLRALDKGTINYEDQRSCFTCHHQTLPMLAQATARQHGFKINEELFRQQTKITHDGFKNRHDKLRSGKGVGGQSMTVAYALWALDIAKWKPDETTEAMVAYLLKTQKKNGRFYVSPTRPPLEDSPAASVTLAAYYLREFASDKQDADADASVARAKKWLIESKPERQEDWNARLWGLHLLDDDEAQIADARKAVLKLQREDGGWSQLPNMESDSYATGQALWMLSESGFSTDDPAYERGVRFLLDTQLEDGSWLVKTRSKPIQTYFESGYPHGKDQFISISGASWAVAALAKTQPRATAAVR
ncbi:MAG: N-acyl-D-amino-acid deacylase, partial [Limisphaerales bacterium]